MVETNAHSLPAPVPYCNDAVLLVASIEYGEETKKVVRRKIGRSPKVNSMTRLWAAGHVQSSTIPVYMTGPNFGRLLQKVYIQIQNSGSPVQSLVGS